MAGNAIWITKDEHGKLVRLKENHGIRMHEIKSHVRPDMVAVVVDDDTFDKLEDYREENDHDPLEPVYLDKRFDPVERGYIVDIGKLSENIPAWKIAAITVAVILLAVLMFISFLRSL